MGVDLTSMGFPKTNSVGNCSIEKIPAVLEETVPMDELVKIKCDQQHRRFICLHGDQQVTTTCPECRGRVVEMAKIFLKTCPGDWNSGPGDYVLNSLRDTVANERASTDGMDIASMISFRWKMTHLADHIVEKLQLAIPSNTPCLLWSKRNWQEDRRRRLGETVFDNKWDCIWRRFIDGHLMPRPSVEQGPEFIRFQQYLVAAIRDSVSSKEDSDELVNKILMLTEEAKASDQELRQGVLDKRSVFKDPFKNQQACSLR
ncbi:hypothetical protein CGRA01v4_07799 [Colletotrichum graminicola]|uniref:Uncharacterized protein n=1 Tax=Colletotrichum graminicola (strain M1.001 / M2 / FGSC 10212) TaxID=645133 RepID=E3QPU0_COLGM|nr:uncharacterized protein GLRG_08011 [Colletotrichum graminicola M1.001]EFQ32867.1 hypothetical protein GLRG_08011 [Colletotrichum graminicola M1.001]WDK16516.1 hypothetical protein CGRA01v4_07799 [Colletotrichum graminicola]